jgi:SpoVK/Ycf46/Vps4 family AAA+-type ATPase
MNHLQSDPPSSSSTSIFTTRPTTTKLAHLELPHLIHHNISNIINQHKHKDQFVRKGLTPNDKLLLEGVSGTGKTSCADAIASELGRTYKLFKLDSLNPNDTASSFRALNQAFEEINQTPAAVYVFDEFDAVTIGRNKNFINPTLLAIANKMLEHLDNKQGDSILIATTNHTELIDSAFKTRFDTICSFEHPSIKLREKAIKEILTAKQSTASVEEIRHAAEKTEGLSFREISKLIQDSIKRTIMDPQSDPDEGILFTPELANVEVRRRNHKANNI